MSELVNKCLELTRAAEVTKSKLSIERFFRGLTGRVSELEITGAELDQLVGVLFLVTALCEDELIEDQSAIGSIEFAAEAFEHLSVLQPEPMISDTLPRSLYSAINYVVANKFSNATLLARERIAAYEARQPTLSRLSDLFSWAIYCLHLLVGSNLDRLHSASAVSNWTDKLQPLLLQFPENYQEITCSILLIDALHNYAGFILTADNMKLKQAHSRLAEAQRVASSVPLLCELVSHAKAVFKTMESCYVVPLLKQFGDTLPSDYVQLLTRGESPVYYLWPPQIKALSEGLLRLKRFAVRLPTSAGKTLLAELKIASALSNSEEALAFYVVPLNALARQIRKDLRSRLRQRPLRLSVKVLTGTYEIGDEELEIAGRKENVIITTPEKLDGLLRNIDRPEIAELFDRCRLFVFDECQTLSLEGRGTTYEFLIARIMSLFPEAQILALSAVLENIDEFGSWIGEESVAYVKDDWRPTRQHWAVWPSQGGLIFDKQWVITGYERTDVLHDDLTRICMDLQKNYENVLVLANSRGNAEKYAAHIAQKVAQSSDKLLSGEEHRRLRGLASRIRRRVHPSCRLADMVEVGVAYHHAHLPNELKSEIEEHIADGTLKYIVSTTTLAQGLNFPIRSLVIPNIYLGGRPISPLQLKNIVGRAGRAHVSTSGQVVIFKSSDWIWHKGRFIPFENYCFEPSKELLKVGSSLELLLNGNSSYEAFDIQESLDSQLLAFLTDESLKGDGVSQSSKIAQSSFLALTQPDSLPKLEQLVQQRLTEMSSEPEPLVTHGSAFTLTEYGDAVRRTGFGPSGSEELRRRLAQILDEDPSFFASFRDGSKLDENKIKSLLTLAFSPLDNLLETFAFRDKAKDLFGMPVTRIRQDMSAFLAILRDEPTTWDRIRSVLEAGDIEFIWRWINGADHEELSKFFLKGVRPTQEQIDRAIMDSIHTVESLHNTLSWTLYSVRTLLEYLLAKRKVGAISPEFDNFSYYVKYGVNHPVSIYLLDSVDWSDRKETLLIASDLPGEVSYFQDLDEVEKSLIKLGEQGIYQKLGSKERAHELWDRLQFPF